MDPNVARILRKLNRILYALTYGFRSDKDYRDQISEKFILAAEVIFDKNYFNAPRGREILQLITTKGNLKSPSYLSSSGFYDFQKSLGITEFEEIFEYKHIFGVLNKCYLRQNEEFLKVGKLNSALVKKDVREIIIAIENNKTLMADIKLRIR